MQEYRIRDTGEVVNGSQLLQLLSNVSFSFKEDQLNDLGVDIVHPVAGDALAVDETYDGTEVVFEVNRYVKKPIIRTLTAEELVEKVVASQKTVLIKINNDDNKIYADVIGNKTTEYLDAAIEAKAFKAAGYPTGVDNDYGLVKSWSVAKQWTMRQATDDIIAQEFAWKSAAKLIREYRLQAKEDVRRATSIAEIESAMLIWNNFVVNIRTQLGVN